MIWFREQRKIIITPPKTGSNTLHYFYCEQGPAIYVMGPHHGFVEKHTTELPFNFKGYTACVVRDPWARIVSYWKHHFKFTPEPHIHDFGEWFLKNELRIRNRKTWFQPLFSYTEAHKGTTILRLEYIESDLRNFGLHVGVFERKNVSPEKDVPHVSQLVVDKIRSVYKDDFCLGGYEEYPSPEVLTYD